MPQRQLGTTLQPKYVGTVVIGDGSRFFTQIVHNPMIARRLAQRWLQRSQAPGGGGTYNATQVPVFADGSVAGGNAAAKTFLQGRSRKRLVDFGGTHVQTARLLRA
jgi:hypothetical protein